MGGLCLVLTMKTYLFVTSHAFVAVQQYFKGLLNLRQYILSCFLENLITLLFDNCVCLIVALACLLHDLHALRGFP